MSCNIENRLVNILKCCKNNNFITSLSAIGLGIVFGSKLIPIFIDTSVEQAENKLLNETKTGINKLVQSIDNISQNARMEIKTEIDSVKDEIIGKFDNITNLGQGIINSIKYSLYLVGGLNTFILLGNLVIIFKGPFFSIFKYLNTLPRYFPKNKAGDIAKTIRDIFDGSKEKVDEQATKKFMDKFNRMTKIDNKPANKDEFFVFDDRKTFAAPMRNNNFLNSFAIPDQSETQEVIDIDELIDEIPINIVELDNKYLSLIQNETEFFIELFIVLHRLFTKKGVLLSSFKEKDQEIIKTILAPVANYRHNINSSPSIARQAFNLIKQNSSLLLQAINILSNHLKIDTIGEAKKQNITYTTLYPFILKILIENAKNININNELSRFEYYSILMRFLYTDLTIRYNELDNEKLKRFNVGNNPSIQDFNDLVQFMTTLRFPLTKVQIDEILKNSVAYINKENISIEDESEQIKKYILNYLNSSHVDINGLILALDSLKDFIKKLDFSNKQSLLNKFNDIVINIDIEKISKEDLIDDIKIIIDIIDAYFS